MAMMAWGVYQMACSALHRILLIPMSPPLCTPLSPSRPARSDLDILTIACPTSWASTTARGVVVGPGSGLMGHKPPNSCCQQIQTSPPPSPTRVMALGMACCHPLQLLWRKPPQEMLQHVLPCCVAAQEGQPPPPLAQPPPVAAHQVNLG